MLANHSGLQWSTVRNLLMAWVLTLPVSIALEAGTGCYSPFCKAASSPRDAAVVRSSTSSKAPASR